MNERGKSFGDTVVQKNLSSLKFKKNIYLAHYFNLTQIYDMRV